MKDKIQRNEIVSFFRSIVQALMFIASIVLMLITIGISFLIYVCHEIDKKTAWGPPKSLFGSIVVIIICAFLAILTFRSACRIDTGDKHEIDELE